MKRPPGLLTGIVGKVFGAPDEGDILRRPWTRDYLDRREEFEAYRQRAQTGSRVEALAELLEGEYLEAAVAMASTEVGHSLGRVPELILWSEGLTTSWHYLTRDLANAWTRTNIYVIGQSAQTYRFILV